MNRFIVIVAVLVLLFNSAFLSAQETLTVDAPKKEAVPEPQPEPEPPPEITVTKRILSLGLLGGYSIDGHSAETLRLPSVPTCCPGYDGATGGGVVGGLSVELPITETIELLTRLTYHNTGVTQTNVEPITVRNGNTTATANITHELTTTLSTVSLEPGIAYLFGESFAVVGGLRLGALLDATYDQSETLDASIPYDYADGSGVRNQSSGKISETNTLQFGMFIGARYMLPMNSSRTLLLVPEVQFVPMFSTFVADQTWRTNSLRLMLGITYAITSTKTEATPLRPR